MTHKLDKYQAAEDAHQRPRCDQEIPDLPLRRSFPVAEKVGHGKRDELPRRRWYYRIEIFIDIEVELPEWSHVQAPI